MNGVGQSSPGNYIALNNVYNIIYIIIENSIVGILPDDTNAQKLAKVNAFFASNDVYLRYRARNTYPVDTTPRREKRKYQHTQDTQTYSQTQKHHHYYGQKRLKQPQ